MTVRTVTLSEDAYEALRARKATGESFSDVVRRLTRSRSSLLEFAGVWKDFPPERMWEFREWLAWNDDRSQQELGRRPRRKGG